MSENSVVPSGQDKVTGRFVKGNSLGKGRPKGSRNVMTKKMLARVAERSEDGLSMEEIMMDIAQDPNMPPELRFKAAAKVADIIYPKASSVEVNMDDSDKLSKADIDKKLADALARAAAIAASL